MGSDGTQPTFEYVNQDGVRRLPFYQVPKFLLEDPFFRSLSNDAILLYAILLDRLELSLENSWFNPDGHAYVICSIKSIQELLRCGHGKAVKLLQELDTTRGIGLIERTRLGRGKPDRLYVKVLSGSVPNSGMPEVSKTEVQSSDNRNSGNPEIGSPEFRKQESNKTNQSQTEKHQPERKESRHKYGAYSNVLLTDEELETLQKEFPTDYEERIETLSEYMASTGKSYKNHLATIRSWNRRERKQQAMEFRREIYETEDTL